MGWDSRLDWLVDYIRLNLAPKSPILDMKAHPQSKLLPVESISYMIVSVFHLPLFHRHTKQLLRIIQSSTIAAHTLNALSPKA
jgi:hypothetical protein